MNAPFTDHAELKKAIVEHIERAGPHCSLNHLDVSQIVNFSELFENSLFNGDLSQWNTRNVQTMRATFADIDYLGDISNWDLSAVILTNSERCFTRYHHSPLYFVEVLSGRQRPPEHLREQLNQYIPLVVSLNMPPLDAARWLMQQLDASAKKRIVDTFEVPTDLMVK